MKEFTILNKSLRPLPVVKEKDGKTYDAFTDPEQRYRQRYVDLVVNPNVKIKPEPVQEVIEDDNPVFVDNFNLSTNDLTQVLEKVIEDNNPYSELISSLLPYINPNTKIVVDENARGLGTFNIDTNTISIHKKHALKGEKIDIAKTIAKEYVHSLTALRMRQHSDDKLNLIIDENTPKDIVELNKVFNEFKKQMGSEMDNFLKDYVRGNPLQAGRQKDVLYAGTNVFEFVEMMMTSPELLKESKKFKYKATNKTLFEQFKEVLNKIMNALTGERLGAFAKDTMSAIMDTVEQQAKSNPKPKRFDKNDNASEELLEPGLAIRDEFGTFVDPFKC